MALSRTLDDTFKVSVTLKGIDGALEIVGGAVLLFVRPTTLDQLARSLTQHELAQDPHDFLARHVLHSAGQLTHGSTLFAAVYLLSHGVAKVVLVVALLRDQLWAYPATIALLGAFIAYQLYRLSYRVTLGLTQVAPDVCAHMRRAANGQDSLVARRGRVPARGKP
jgi:uncharacterized membrane protein